MYRALLAATQTYVMYPFVTAAYTWFLSLCENWATGPRTSFHYALFRLGYLCTCGPRVAASDLQTFVCVLISYFTRKAPVFVDPSSSLYSAATEAA